MLSTTIADVADRVVYIDHDGEPAITQVLRRARARARVCLRSTRRR